MAQHTIRRLTVCEAWPMDENRADFLSNDDRDHRPLARYVRVERGEPLLASVLAIAKGEAEDALRHANELQSLMALARQDGEHHELAADAAGRGTEETIAA